MRLDGRTVPKDWSEHYLELIVNRKAEPARCLGSLGRQVASQQHYRGSEADQKRQLVTCSL